MPLRISKPVSLWNRWVPRSIIRVMARAGQVEAKIAVCPKQICDMCSSGVQLTRLSCLTARVYSLRRRISNAGKHVEDARDMPMLRQVSCQELTQETMHISIQDAELIFFSLTPSRSNPLLPNLPSLFAILVIKPCCAGQNYPYIPLREHHCLTGSSVSIAPTRPLAFFTPPNSLTGFREPYRPAYSLSPATRHI